MLTPNEFDNWCRRQNLGCASRKTIEIIRTQQPSRRVGGGKKNVSGRYPSRKMGATIQFESHKVELPFIYQLEHDEDVLEFYDQPPAVKLNYQSKDGRNLGFLTTPDFFVIRTNCAGWVECKTEDNLKKLASSCPNRFYYGEDNLWHTPPGEKYASQFGFFFRLVSDSEINWVLQRNLNFLEDYYRSSGMVVSPSATKTIKSLVSIQPGITLLQLLYHTVDITADDIYFLIATSGIYVDLTAAPLVEPERCFVFGNQLTANAYSKLVSSQTQEIDGISSPIVKVAAGSELYYDGKRLTIDLVGETSILLRTENLEPVQLPLTTFNQLLKLGKITGSSEQVLIDGISSEVREILLKASEKDLFDANHRYKILEPWLRGEAVEYDTVSERTVRYWKHQFKQAQQKYGYGYIGLLSHDRIKGNRNRKLPLHILELMQKFINSDYETYKQKRKVEVYGAFALALSEAGISEQEIPSYKTFIQEIKRCCGEEQTAKRSGHRAAYSQEPFYWELEVSTPRHGERPFEICHIDHTQVDIELRCSRTGKVLGKPWVTFLVDAYSRRILAVYITFDPPSYRSCMMVLRICVNRHSRLPQIIVVDNGSEFHSTYFQTFNALFECTLKYRPASKARFGAVGERLFGTAMTQMVYNLAGNTQITKKVRLMTKSVNPKNLALWTLELFYHYLCEWAYEIYDTTEHPNIGQSPREAYQAGIAQFGSRSHRMISYDSNFKLLTLPTTAVGKVKVDPTLGVQINYLHYWNSAFRDPEIQNTCVQVRYDPFDAGIAYAYIRGHWVECISEYYSIFKGRSEKEIQLATNELKKRHQNHAQRFKVKSQKLAEFLNSAEAEEVMLSQRLRDAQGQEVFLLIEGAIPNHNPYCFGQIKNEQTQDNFGVQQAPTINSSSLKIYLEY